MTAFKQFICGFDFLRSNDGSSFVIDVNGWSFVKGNTKYYADCSHILRNWMVDNLRPEWIKVNMPTIVANMDVEPNHRPKIIQGSTEELRSVVGIFRHGDRTPKQKLKMKTDEPLLLQFFNGKAKNIKIKLVDQLEEILHISSEILQRDLDEDTYHKYDLIHNILSREHIEGINRKIQMKPIEIEDNKVKRALFIMKWGGNLTHAGIK